MALVNIVRVEPGESQHHESDTSLPKRLIVEVDGVERGTVETRSYVKTGFGNDRLVKGWVAISPLGAEHPMDRSRQAAIRRLMAEEG